MWPGSGAGGQDLVNKDNRVRREEGCSEDMPLWAVGGLWTSVPLQPTPHPGHALQLRERGSRREPPVLVRRGQSNPAFLHFAPTCFSLSFMLLRGCKRLPKSRRKRCVGCGVCVCVYGLSCVLGGGGEGPRSRNDVANPFSILLVGQC